MLLLVHHKVPGTGVSIFAVRDMEYAQVQGRYNSELGSMGIIPTGAKIVRSEFIEEYSKHPMFEYSFDRLITNNGEMDTCVPRILQAFEQLRTMGWKIYKSNFINYHYGYKKPYSLDLPFLFVGAVTGMHVPVQPYVFYDSSRPMSSGVSRLYH